MMDTKRIAAVTAGLAMAGALVGGMLGAGFMAAVVVLEEGPRVLIAEFETVMVAALLSAMFGVVLGPLAAWMLMRHVPLWIAIGGTALGTLAGVGASYVFNGNLIYLPLLGFFLSAVALRLLVRRSDGSRVAA